MFVNLNDITDSTFATFMRPLLGTGNQRRQRPEEHPLAPKFQGRELPISEQLDAVARRDARMRELNASTKPVEPSGIVAKVVDVVPVLNLVGKARAAAFLREQLASGPVPSAEIDQRATTAGITRTALRRGRDSLKIKPQKVGRAWFWALPAES